MRIFKTAMFIGTLALVTHGYGFDLPRMALKTAARYLPQPAHSEYQKAPTQARGDGDGPSPDIKLPSGSANFEACRENFANGKPPLITSQEGRGTRPLCFNGFAVLHSASTKTPVYSAEVLNRERITKARNEARTDVFFEDARLPARERASLQDYRASTYDRGHLSPAADMDSPQAMAQSFSLANMVPQAPENNRKAWADIEKATRSYVQRASGNVYVITGPAYEQGQCQIVQAAKQALSNAQQTIPAQDEEIIATARTQARFHEPRNYDLATCTIGQGVKVPSHLFKLVYDPSTNRAWAHWLQNTDAARVRAPISYEELVKRTGIEFLPGVRPLS